MAASYPKWDKYYQRPFVITAQTGPLNFRVQKRKRGRTFIAHVDKLSRNLTYGDDEPTEPILDSPALSIPEEEIANLYGEPPTGNQSILNEGEALLDLDTPSTLELKGRTDEKEDDSPARRRVLRPRNRLLQPIRFRN